MAWRNTVGDDARDGLLKGATLLAEAVGSTMGPAGRNCVIDHTPYTPSCPLSTRDGITVCRSFYISGDPIADAGVRLMRAASEKTVEVAGDGTSATIVLAHGFFSSGLKPTTGIRQVLDQITSDCDYAVGELEKMVVPVSGNMIDHVSTIACNNNPALGKAVADAIRTSGPHGVISVEESSTTETEVVREEGMQFAAGWRSSGFVNRQDNQSVEFDAPVIFMLDRKLTSLQGLEPMLAGVIKTGRPLLILASDTDGEALAQLLILKQQGKLQVCCVSMPKNLGPEGEVLKDVAAIVGGNPMLKELQQNPADVKSDDLGSARRAVITKNTIRILAGASNADRKKKRIEEIRGLLASAPSQLEMERLQERLAKLTGGVTILKLGSQTQLEGADIKLRVDDAICAIKCAIDGGVVPGGGTALLRVAQNCHYKGVLESPFRRILTNAGYDPDQTKEEVLLTQNPWWGFNALTGDFCDLKEAGILDPFKVVRESLLNAASVARQSLLTNTVISLIAEK